MKGKQIQEAHSKLEITHLLTRKDSQKMYMKILS